MEFKNSLEGQYIKEIIILDYICDKMQEYSAKYAVIIMAEGKNTQLYPLTKNYPASLLPIANKKLILYQLEAIQNLTMISKIYIVLNETNTLLEEYYEHQFIKLYPEYPFKISFIHVEEAQPNYCSFQQAVSKIEQHKGYIIIPNDIICSISLLNLVELHEKRNSDCTLLLKSKKQIDSAGKPTESDIQNEVDFALIGDNDSLLWIDMIEEFDSSGLKIHSSLYRRAKSISVKKVIDSRIYILSTKTIKICQNLHSGELTQIKHDLIPTLVKNQTNINLLKHFSKQPYLPLHIHCMLTDSQEYIKRISSIKAYELINLDSLIRGSKQKNILIPTKYTTKPHPNFDTTKTGLIVGQDTTIEEGFKIRRSVIEDSCQVGKNVEILNSVIMRGVKINDNCKISESIIGCQVKIGEGCVIKGCQVASKTKIPSNSKRQGQIIIPFD